MQGKGRGRGAPPTATERNLEVTSACLSRALPKATVAGSLAFCEAVTSSWSVSAPELKRGAEVEAGVGRACRA